jgi:hypothetical protein
MAPPASAVAAARDLRAKCFRDLLLHEIQEVEDERGGPFARSSFGPCLRRFARDCEKVRYQAGAQFLRDEMRNGNLAESRRFRFKDLVTVPPTW